MKQVAVGQFTHGHNVSDDGTVRFQCSSDIDQWPWLALHPFDPIVVQTINFWASVETGAARGTFDPTKWSALTQTKWTCGNQGVGHAASGIADAIGEQGGPGYRIRFFDADDSLVYSMSGTGVVFQNRDFESWREKTKKKVVDPIGSDDFQYAPAEAVGVTRQSEAFISPLVDGDTPGARALITKDNGFPPAHPYLSGSGDHVNATHLADVARQFAQLLSGGKRLCITKGEMGFKRYVELGRPFDIMLEEREHAAGAQSMIIEQADHLCATIRIRHGSN